MVSILGGLARGFDLKVPKGDTIRPTSVLLKRRVFDAHQDLDGYSFIDLCAGSGAMGLEAASRGATPIYLLEADRRVYSLLKDNSQRFANKFPGISISCNQGKAQKWIEDFCRSYQSWDQSQKEQTIIFLDPPYERKEIYHAVIDFVIKDNWFCGELWVESDRQKGISLSELEKSIGTHDHAIKKSFQQGTSYIAIVDF